MELSGEVGDRLRALLGRLEGRAAGAWRVEGGTLAQVAFVTTPDMAAEVARGFAAATERVDLGRVELAIARAAATAFAVVSIAEELPAGTGSGFWLRAFGAARSIAVPVEGANGRVAWVVSVALGAEPSAAEVEAAIRGEGWPG